MECVHPGTCLPRSGKHLEAYHVLRQQDGAGFIGFFQKPHEHLHNPAHCAPGRCTMRKTKAPAANADALRGAVEQFKSEPEASLLESSCISLEVIFRSILIIKSDQHCRHIGTKVIAYNPRRRCGRRRVGVSDLAPVSSWGDEDTIEQGPGVRIVRGEDEEERP